ncbi:MAG: DUF58 domain-containing protein [Armatimonadetes bacterium]|nr:DUF58 domain-containing protein [Armatimonadota bacterium]
MPTREGTSALLLAGAVFLLATNLASGLLFVLDALLVSLLFVGAATAHVPLRRLRVEQQAPARGVEGVPLPVEITLESPRGGRFFVVECGWSGARARALVPHAVPGVRATISLTVVPPVRGRFALEPVTVASRGPLGLFAASRKFPANGGVTIWPRTRPVPSGVMAHLIPVLEGGSSGARTRQAEDLYGVRDYRWGDNPAHIHWRSSARRGALVVREFERPVTPGAAIVVDLDSRQSPEQLDAVVRAAASLFQAALDREADVVLTGWEEGVVQHRGREPAMDWLAGVTPCSPPVAEVLPKLAASGRHLIVVAANTGSEAWLGESWPGGSRPAGGSWPEGVTPVLPAVRVAGASAGVGTASGLVYMEDGTVQAW